MRPVLFHPKLGVGPKGLDRERMVEYPTLARRAVERQLEMAAIGLKSHCFVEFLRVFVVEAAGAQIRRLRPVHILHGGKAADRFTQTGDDHIESRRVKELVNMLL